jgi:hypothetical protein
MSFSESQARHRNRTTASSNVRASTSESSSGWPTSVKQRVPGAEPDRVDEHPRLALLLVVQVIRRPPTILELIGSLSGRLALTIFFAQSTTCPRMLVLDKSECA